jgi:hypothetical protein
LNSLRRERSEEFVFSGLLQIAVRLKSDHQEAPAQLLLERLSQADIPPEICEQAKREHGAMIGSGGSMMRLEYHLSGFAAGGGGYLREIAPVLGAGMLGQIAGTIFLGRLGGMAGRFWNRGWGRKLAVGAVSYLAELPAFVGLSRACSPEGGGALGPGWLPAALGLGVLRGSHFLGNQGVLGIQRLNRSAGLTKFAQTSLPLGTLFAGLYGSHHLQVALGLQPQVKDATTGVDVLHSMAILLPGLSLGNALLGRSWAALRQEMEMRADFFPRHGETRGPALPSSRFLSTIPVAGEVHRMIPVKFMGFEGPEKPRLLQQAKKPKDKWRSQDADVPWDKDFSDLGATQQTFSATFITGIRGLRGRSSLTASPDLEGPFAKINASVRLSVAFQITNTLLTEEFNPFQRTSAFSAMIRHLSPQEQLDFALHLYDRFLALEQIRPDLENHAQQCTSIFSALHPENFLPFLSGIQACPQNNGCPAFVQACLRHIASPGGGKA